MARHHEESQLEYLKRLRKEYKEAESALLDADTEEEVEKAEDKLEVIEEKLEDAEVATDTTTDSESLDEKTTTEETTDEGTPSVEPAQKAPETQRTPQSTHMFERRIGRKA